MDADKVIGGLANSGIFAGYSGWLGNGILSCGGFARRGEPKGLSAIAELAWKGYRHYRETNGTQQGKSPQLPMRFPIENSCFVSTFDRAVCPGGSWLPVQAMISAAMADGHVTADEASAKLGELCLSSSEQRFLANELLRPKSVEELASAVSDLQTAIEVYAAALVATDVTRPDGTAFLAKLARRLWLPQPLLDSIHTRAKDGSVSFFAETAGVANYCEPNVAAGRQEPQELRLAS